MVDYLDEQGNVYVPKNRSEVKCSKATGEEMTRFSSEVTDKKSWDLHLADQNLNPAKPGMEILSAAGFAEKKKADPGVKATFQRGSHDKDWSCSVTVKRMW